MQVLLIGTSHAYQFGEGVTFGDTTCTREIATQFRQYLAEICSLHGIRAIAEEMSIEALEEMKCTVSFPKLVADDLALSHRYCDSTRQERSNMGIRDGNFIRMVGQMSGKSPDEIEEEIRVERLKREPIWLTQLQLLNTWPVLFICGAWHVLSFATLLQRAGHPTDVVAHDWGSNPSGYVQR